VAGIAGIDRAGKQDLIARMIEKMAYRGRGDLKLVEADRATLGAVSPGAQATLTSPILKEQAVWDARHPPVLGALGREREPFTLAVAMPPIRP
jgi:hypothetical protein